jgi:hypothetical protein
LIGRELLLIISYSGFHLDEFIKYSNLQWLVSALAFPAAERLCGKKILKVLLYLKLL